MLLEFKFKIIVAQFELEEMVFDELLGFSIKDFLVINFVVPRRGDEELLHLLAVDLLVQFLLAEVIFFLQGTLLFQRWRLVY